MGAILGFIGRNIATIGLTGTFLVLPAFLGGGDDGPVAGETAPNSNDGLLRLSLILGIAVSVISIWQFTRTK